jgi:hypothetical protein
MGEGLVLVVVGAVMMGMSKANSGSSSWIE